MSDAAAPEQLLVNDNHSKERKNRVIADSDAESSDDDSDPNEEQPAEPAGVSEERHTTAQCEEATPSLSRAKDFADLMDDSKLDERSRVNTTIPEYPKEEQQGQPCSKSVESFAEGQKQETSPSTIYPAVEHVHYDAPEVPSNEANKFSIKDSKSLQSFGDIPKTHRVLQPTQIPIFSADQIEVSRSLAKPPQSHISDIAAGIEHGAEDRAIEDTMDVEPTKNASEYLLVPQSEQLNASIEESSSLQTLDHSQFDPLGTINVVENESEDNADEASRNMESVNTTSKSPVVAHSVQLITSSVPKADTRREITPELPQAELTPEQKRIVSTSKSSPVSKS